MKTFLHSLLLSVFLIPSVMWSQTTVTGTVADQANVPLPGVNILIKGTTTGATTDFDGNFSITASNGDVIVFSYVGFKPQEITYTGQQSLNVTLTEDAAQLDEIVLIGYGSVKKEDLTGSVDVVSSKDFNKGAILSTDQLLTGKAAGVRITTDGGSPDSAPNIRIRGGASLNANNNPLIVIDGVPIGNDNPAGVSNPLSLVNPNDIESFSILKDASAAAIYGTRASNGVIIITTKRGTSGATKFNFSTNLSVSKAGDGLDVMTSSEYVKFIQEYHPDFVGSLGVDPTEVSSNALVAQTLNGRDIYDSDWRDAVYRTAFTSNTNFSASANLFDKIPFRGSIGYSNAEGVIKTDDYERVSAALKLNPKFFDDNLKLDVNAKLTYADKNAIDGNGALAGALVFDPTKPIYDTSADNRFGGYYMNTNADGNRLILDGQFNPLALLQQRERPQEALRFLGNIEFDYTMPFLPELKAVVNLGLDASKSTIEERYFDNAVASYRFDSANTDINNNFVFNPGVNYSERQDITNTTLDAYGQYTKSFEEGILNKFDIQAGYSYQNFKNDGNQDRFDYDTETGLRFEVVNPENINNRYYNVLNLQSYFGRTNIDIDNKYLLTLSIRADGSSLFTEENRWGYFPAAALAWKVKEESFLKNVEFIDELKIRLGYGQTGQQDITGVVGFYPSIPLFQAGDSNSQYLPNSSLYSALPFNPNLTWEKTTTYNLGLDFNVFSNLLSGSFDIYKRETTDLLAQVPVPPGQAFSDRFIDNVGATESEGFELNLNLNPIQTENFSFNINGNVAYNTVEITDLGGRNNIGIGGSLRGTGALLLYHALGEQPESAFVFKQVYDTDGNPIPNAFVDLNGDNQITNDDRYFEQIVPNWTYGFGLNFNYKNWDLSSSFRGQLGGNVYNFNLLNYGFIESALPANNTSISNVLNFYDGAANPVFDNVRGNVQFSDYYLKDATFLRCDNIAIGYNFKNIIKDASLRLSGAVSNPFLITDYEGQDPENFGGIDGNFYPRPTVYTFGINLDF
ncbi:iron complex outermembrane receptor protein [Gelidibacter algens]|uniref:Iron complex outermembrane receptor protein n=1 Tax=Gelidibacter algens TaxID=49280 RepID=A0A1A7R5K7_9FLAO|nr:TonB-dependent receptor [Gelidibacter algens]OBX26754.1 SusC/RagA family TonB-linked outer membrane protein [Gelidibacter algens]RAJ22801.1 iron complex outermembrane receptor protein [Gelidibacter algens]